MTSASNPIVFLSGAGLAPWAWDEVRAVLGIRSTVVPRPAGPSATLLDYAEAAIAAAPEGEFTVVAHSVGGVVGAEVVRLAPGRVQGFLAVAAAIPEAGESFVSAMPAPQRWALGAAMRLAGTRPPDRVIRRGLADGLPEHVVERVVADFTTESRGLYLDRVGARAWPARRGYVTTSRDRELSPALQRRFSRRLDPTWEEELASGHLPMVQSPDTLAAAIQRFLAD